MEQSTIWMLSSSAASTALLGQGERRLGVALGRRAIAGQVGQLHGLPVQLEPAPGGIARASAPAGNSSSAAVR